MIDMSQQLQPNYQPLPWNKPMCEGFPTPGYEHDPRARIALHRQLNGVPALGICHNTCDADMEAFYILAHLAARRALLVDGLEEIHFLEVGTWCGESAIMLATAVRDVVQRYLPNEEIDFHLWVVDTFEGTATDHIQSVAQGYGGSIREMCADNLMQLEYPYPDTPGLRIHVHIIEGKSAQIAQSFADNPDHDDHVELHLVNIDAGHTWHEAYDDIEAWFPFLRPGAWIIGHDYNDTMFPGVIVAVDQQAQKLGHCSPLAVPGSTVWGFRKPLPPER